MHAGSDDAVAPDDDAEVVQRAIWPEYGFEQPLTDLCVKVLAGFDDPAEFDGPLDSDDGAELAFAKELHSTADCFDDGGEVLALPAEPARLPQADHGLAQLGLKDDDQEDGQQAEESVIYKVQSAEGVRGLAEDANEQRQDDQEHGYALDDPGAACSPEEAEHEVNPNPDHSHLEYDLVKLVTADEVV